jgi:glucose/arabinose dehydrogenase
MRRPLALFVLVAIAAACRSEPGGGGQTEVTSGPPNPADVALPAGYRIEVVATKLDFPAAITFDEAGTPYVLEAGYSYGEVFGEPHIKRITPQGTTEIVAKGGNPPWTGITLHGDRFYVSEGGGQPSGRILSIGKGGDIQIVVDNLPSKGDHQTNAPVIGPDGALYFSQGTATNSGVVGEDSADFGWLKRAPDFHDIPCEDITLRGENYETKNPLTPDENDKATTGAFVPFGTRTEKGQLIRGQVPCSGAIFRVPLSTTGTTPQSVAAANGGNLEVVAWGFRNPFGLAFAPDGSLFVTENGYDDRGSRPAWGTGDVLWKIEKGRWYGWPDFSAGRSLAEDRFGPPGQKAPAPLLERRPPDPPAPVAIFAVHSSTNGIDFSRSARFGHVGEAFVAQFGDMSPGVGTTFAPVGFKVLRVDVTTGVIDVFATNKGDKNGPASKIGGGGLERPVAVRFDPSGDALYVVDFGIMTIGEQGPQPRLGTGTIWRITKEASQ